MTLKFNETQQTYLLMSDDMQLARNAGLTMSRTARGPKGEHVWYTSDPHNNTQMVDNPYAALPFFAQAEGVAKDRLAPLYADYQASWADSCQENYPAPDGKEYMGYQRAGIKYCLDKHHSLIGDEPGLGKTIQALGVSNATGAERVLILCPASIRLNWKREIKEWSIIRNRHTHDGLASVHPILSSKNGVHPDANFVVASYDLARNEGIFDALFDMRWDLLVLDEGHYLKSLEAQRTRAVFGGGMGYFKDKNLASRADKIVSLTGTPLPNRPRECYTLARGLCWESLDWSSYDNFKFKFNPSQQIVIPEKNPFDDPYGRKDRIINKEGRGRLPELQARLRSNFMVRRHKKDVLKDLPDKRYEFTYVEENGDIRDVLAKEALIDFDPHTLYNSEFKIDGQIATVRREMGEAMVPRVIEHMKYMLDVVEKPKIALFAYHKSVMNALYEGLQRYGVLVRTGGQGAERQQQAVDMFAQDEELNYRVFLGQLDTLEGADGLQHVTDLAVFAEPAWNPGRNEQVVDRLHRFGQHGNVIAQFLMAEGSFNEKVLHLVLDKAQDIHATLDDRLDQ